MSLLLAGFLLLLAMPQATPAQATGSIAGIVQSADTRERFSGLGFEPRGTSPEDLERHIKSELARWSGVIKAQGIKPE